MFVLHRPIASLNAFDESCQLFVELEFDKLEIWIDENGPHLSRRKSPRIPNSSSPVSGKRRGSPPSAFAWRHDVPAATLAGITKAAKLLRITQITIPRFAVGDAIQYGGRSAPRVRAADERGRHPPFDQDRSGASHRRSTHGRRVVPGGPRAGDDARSELLHVGHNAGTIVRPGLSLRLPHASPRLDGRRACKCRWASANSITRGSSISSGGGHTTGALVDILPTPENVGEATARASQTANAARYAALELRTMPKRLPTIHE